MFIFTQRIFVKYSDYGGISYLIREALQKQRSVAHCATLLSSSYKGLLVLFLLFFSVLAALSSLTAVSSSAVTSVTTVASLLAALRLR